MQRLTLLILILISINSCTDRVEKYEYYEFRKQITPSGKYVIYDYARFGPFAFSSGISGTEVFKIGETFSEGKGEYINGVISEWLSDDTLLVYNFNSDLKQPKDTLPIKIDYSKLGDFIVKTIYYKSNSGGRAIYNFDSVATTNDSIFIQIVPDKKGKQILSFPLGATTIKTESDSITHIEISTRLHKSMDFIYYNADGTTSTGLPEVGTTWYDLTPIKKISPKYLNERKIFWEGK